jgi:hypothetical protein
MNGDFDHAAQSIGKYFEVAQISSAPQAISFHFSGTAIVSHAHMAM